MPVIGRDEILARVPHAGRMCLIDEVTAWDEGNIVCLASNHRRAEHPLRRFGRLSALHLIEYAAQATAIHGSLIARDQRAPPGMLAAARDFHTALATLDDLGTPLHIHARPQLLRADGTIYAFEISTFDAAGAPVPVARGRVSVMLAA